MLLLLLRLSIIGPHVAREDSRAIPFVQRLEADREAMPPQLPLTPANKTLCAGGIRGFLLGCLFPLGALMFLAATGEPIGAPVDLHRRFPLLFVIDLAPFVLGAAGCWIGALLHRSRQAEHEQRRLAATLAESWSEGAVAHDADIESLLRNGYRRTAAVSHELRTPLTAVVGFTDLIEAETAEAAVLDYVTEIRTSCDFMLGLINEFLEAERTVAGVFKVAPEPVHLEAAVESVVRLLAPVAQQRSLALRFEDGGGTHVVLADPRRLQQVFTNLIANAINYTPQGGVTVSISERAGEAFVDITDTGVGMTESETARLFAPFQRGESSHTTGTGLGLSLARSMMEAMDGSVSAHSDGPGRGTTMTLTLPLDQVSQLQAV